MRRVVSRVKRTAGECKLEKERESRCVEKNEGKRSEEQAAMAASFKGSGREERIKARSARQTVEATSAQKWTFFAILGLRCALSSTVVKSSLVDPVT